jgi:tetratricopeptide (TPR) repeat protein
MLEIEHLVRSSLLLLSLIFNYCFAQTHPNLKIDSLLNAGINDIIMQQYSSAKNTFSFLDEHFNENPLGNIYLAANEIAKTVDYEEELNQSYLDSLLAIAKSKTDLLLQNDYANIWHHYYEALIYGYQAYYSALTTNLVSAFADGVLSLQSFQKCLDIDSEFAEAYIALGTYNYWKSAQVKSLLWLPFIPDNREDGIAFLEKSINADSYNKYLAAYSLVWIYIDYDESRKAVDLSLKMLNEYEESRFFQWGLARAYQDIDKRKAIDVYFQLLKSVETIHNHNQFNEVVLKHKIAMLYNEVGEFNKSYALCNEILNFKFKSDKIEKRLHDRIRRASVLKENLAEKLINKN